MMEIKHKTFVILPGTLLATQHSLATVSGLMAVLDPSGHLMPFFAVKHLVCRCPSGCLALYLTSQCTPGRIGRKSPKTIDTPWKSAISGMICNPSVCAFFISCQIRMLREHLSCC